MKKNEKLCFSVLIAQECQQQQQQQLATTIVCSFVCELKIKRRRRFEYKTTFCLWKEKKKSNVIIACEKQLPTRDISKKIFQQEKFGKVRKSGGKKGEKEEREEKGSLIRKICDNKIRSLSFICFHSRERPFNMDFIDYSI